MRALGLVAMAAFAGLAYLLSTTPIRGFVRASSSTEYSSSTVRGRKAFRTSGRSNATRAIRPLTS